MPTDRPWMRALEMQYAILRQVVAARDSGVVPVGSKKWELAHDGAMFLRIAQPFAWTHETAMAVMMASKSVPLTTTFQRAMLPERSMWWWFGEASPLRNHNGHAIAAVLCGTYDNGDCECQGVSLGPTGLMNGHLSFGFQWPEGQSITAMVGAHGGEEGYSRVVADLARFVAAACAWMAQRVLVFGDGHIERHRRKQITREHNVPLPSDVKVIQLRRAEYQASPRVGAPEPVDWSCRWIVNGHWRNQRYANERKLIYIMPFVKGPADRPLRVPTHTVYQVSR